MSRYRTIRWSLSEIAPNSEKYTTIAWVNCSNRKANPFEYATIPEIKLYNSDLLEYDWTNADFILANSTWFESDFMTKIYEKSKSWKEGTWMITLTKKLPPNDEWEFVLQTKKQMSWAQATVNLYKKKEA